MDRYRVPHKTKPLSEVLNFKFNEKKEVNCGNPKERTIHKTNNILLKGIPHKTESLSRVEKFEKFSKIGKKEIDCYHQQKRMIHERSS